MNSVRVAAGLAAVLCLAGCSGGAAPTPPAAEGAVTFTEHVAPILYGHCSRCHRPGESAPFDLLTYRDARKHDRQIVEVTSSGFMPPWLPADGYGEFEGRRGLSEAELSVLERWYKGGSIEGDPDRLPPPPHWTEGWQLGEPDLVIQPDETYMLPADGIDVFRNLVIPIPIDRKRYVRTIDLRPGNPRIVHHAVMRVDRSSSSRLLDEEDEEPGYPGMEWGEALPPKGHFLGWTPGNIPYPGREDSAWELYPGSDLVVQLHMLPDGRPEPIRPRVGLYFADSPPTRVMEVVALDAQHIDIPAGEKNYVVEESYRLPVEVEVVSVYPHAHYLGKQMWGWAMLPDGTKQWLIHIPDWDFNWQDQYRYVEPVRLPAGSTIAMRYTYDNSSDNVRNPSSPPVRVVLGDRSTDEMASMSFEVLLRDEADRVRLEESLLRQDIEAMPENWIAHGLLGKLLLDRGEYREAAQHLLIAVRLKSDYAVGHNNLGAALYALGQTDRAVASFRRALALKPDFADAHYNLAVDLAARGRLDEAIEHYGKALSVRSYDPDFHNNLAVALARKGRTSEAMQHVRRALELDPDSADAHGNLGTMLMQAGRYDEAIEHYRRALEIRPDSEDLQYNLSVATSRKQAVERPAPTRAP